MLRRIRSAPFVVAPKHAAYRLVGLNPRAERKLDLYLSRRAYRHAHGRYPDLDRPFLFTEKVLARKLFEEGPIFFRLSDKLLARDFVAERAGGQYLPMLLGVHRHFDEIDFARLPERFVIKTNHGSRFVLVVDGSRPFDKAGARRLVQRWMKTNYYDGSREKFYRFVARKIMVEELLTEHSGAPAVDYRFFVYDGTPRFFYTSYRPQASGAEARLLAESDGRMLAFFDRECRRIPVRQVLPGMPPTPREYFESLDRRWPFPIPANIDEMFDVAGKMGRGFDFVRIDMYNPGGRILFGEITTIPGGGLIRFDPPAYDRLFGEPWTLRLTRTVSAGGI